MASGKKSFEKLINEKQKNEQKIIAEDRKKHPELYDRKSLISQAKKRSEEKVDLITSDGKNLGKISRMGLYSLNSGKEYTPKDNAETKTIENYREYASSLEKEKRINSNPTTKKYGIDPDNFTKADFEKWAEKHGFEYRMSGNDLTGAEMKWLPKQKGGWKFWEVVPSKEEQADKKTLEILAENNSRKAASQTDRGAVSAAITGAIDGLTFGGVSAYADWDAKRDYKKAGLNPDAFVSYKDAYATTIATHPIANTVGNIAGSTLPFAVLGAEGGVVESGLSKIPKYADLAKMAAKGMEAANKTKNLIDAVVTVGTTTAVSSTFAQDWKKDDWYKSVGNVVLDTATSSLGAYLGGHISAVAGQKVASLLKDTKLSKAAVMGIVSSSGALAFAGTTTGVQEMKNAIKCAANGTKYRPDIKSIATNMVVLTLYSGLKTYVMESVGTSSTPAYEKPFEYFTEEDMKSPEALKKKMRQYTKSYHPDKFQSKGETAVAEANEIFSKITAEYDRAKQKCAVNILDNMGNVKKSTNNTSANSKTINDAVVLLNEVYSPDGTADSANVSAATVFTDKNTAISENTPVQPSDTIVATSVAAAAATTPQSAPTVVASKPDTAIKTNTGGELGEIMDSEPIVTFTPKTASSEVKRLENILIAKGADDTSRKEIIDTAVEIEKNLGSSDKNIRSVFDDVSKITSTAVSEIQSQAGLSNAYWKLFGENFKNVMAGTAKENINLVTEYSNAYAKALKNNNPEKYNSVMLSSDGNDLSGELPKTVMQNIIPNNTPNAEKYKLIATRIKNIINTADVQLESERNKIYGEKNTAAIENNAESTKIQTVAGPKNITLTRVGDFYETFGDEAVELANKLNLTLTPKSINGERVQMVGFPVSSLERYAQALGKGYNISISDTPRVTNQMAQNTPARTENATVNEDATDADIINHAKEVDGLKLTDTEESTLINGKTLITGIYELNSDKDFGRKAYKKEKIDYFRKSGNPWTETANGTTYGHYGFYKYKDGQYLVIHLPTGIGITDVKTESKAESLIKAFDDNLPELPISIKAFGDEYRCDGITQETSELIKNIINSDDENTSEIKLPLKNKKELITYLKKHKGDKIGVSYNQGAEDVRTIVSASDTVIVTERADGQRGELRAKANELSYAEDGFVYTGSNGATVSYRFIEENTSSEKAPESKSDIENSESVTENTDSVTGIKYDHLYDEEKVSKAYLNSVNPEIENAIISIRNGDIASVPDVINVTELDEKTIKAISELVGFDVSGYACRIEKDAIMHIENRHGINGEHDHSLSDPKDTARMGYVINNSDSVSWIKESDGSVKTSKKYKDKNNKYAKLVMMQKKIDGTYCVSDVVPDSKNKTVWITSARIQKKHQDLNDTQVSPKTTSDNALNASNNNISQESDIVNNSVGTNAENDTTALTDKCELIATKHTATGNDIWVVSLKDRLSPEEYKDLSGKVKSVGGYYSRFAKTPDGKAIPGFVFKTEPTAEQLDVFNNFFGDAKKIAPAENKSGIKEIDVNAFLGAVETAKSGDEIKLSDYEKADSDKQNLNNKPESDIIKKKPTTQIAEYVTDKLSKGEKVTALELSKISSEAFGGTMADNAYNIKDAYDAMELGVNKYILSMKNVSVEKMLKLLELLPTQTKRTEGMVKYQQFSTPPSIAYLANYVANVNSKDTMLEPSAGIGGIAVFAKRDGATVYVNELDNRRLEILKNMPFDRFFNENAEQLDNILGGKIEPSVIVMNPPFSSSSERNMQNTKIGAKHIEQALKILAPNGRLVAIVGHGMGDGAPAFRSWWKDIKSQYNVKANIRINGKNYNKYGTNFDIQMLVIDKNGATTHTETGYVDTLQELQEKLEVLRNERPAFNYSENEQRTASTTRSETVEARKDGLLRNRTVSDNGGIADNGSNTRNVENAQKNGRKSELQNVYKADELDGNSAAEVPKKSNVMADEQGNNRYGRGNGLSLGGDNGLQNTGRTNGNVNMERSEQSGISGDNGNARIERNNAGRQRLKKKELTDSIFEQYQTQPLKLKNTKPHPAKVSESAAMSAIEPPVITYKPNIPQNVVENGVLSDVQLEAISYAGQSHSHTLSDGTTRGFFLGDGTGIGKGRTIAGMILDNYNQGRKKSLWVTLNASLVNDAKRDVKSVFGNSDLVTQFVGGKKADNVLNKDEAIMVISYTALSTGYDNVGSNFEKIIDWLGKDFDGLIVFDESHKMGNASPTKGIRGVKKASKTGLAGIALQEALPKAKIVYSSATGATEVENLRYAERLGLWGEGTAFATGDDFISKIKAGGLAAMELIARDMKAMGVYLSRNISYEDVRYDKITHKLSREQRKIYDELARSWQIVLNDINKALSTTNQSKDGTARGRALGAFWSSQQRFFNQILTSMQVPSVISDIEKQLADGKSCVIQLVSTNESAQNEEFVRLKENDLELDEFDLTPKQMLMSYIENSFPVQQFEEYRDDEGNIKSKAVFDSKGNPVLNRDAVRQRDELLSKLGSIKVPSSPIDMIINHFGTDMVAENTGRKRRVVKKDGKLVEEKIGSKKDADVDAFQSGKKRIIIFSKAGGTGKSYHADKAAKNQQQRVHYLLEAGWQADNAVQGFGRSHRSNQAVAPIFKLVTTDLKGQMRFISTIAKRLDQLGAMTKGQRQAGGQGMFSASDNLENSLAQDVLAVFYKDLILNRVDGIDDGLEIISKLGLKDKILNEYNQAIPTAPELREVNKFLNRILSLESLEQNTVFEGYQQRLQDATEKAMLAGTLDKGLENYKADKITLNEVQDIREDERSGAKTKYYNLTAEHKIKPVKFENIPTESKAFVGYYQNKTTGNVRAVVRTSSTTDQYGNVTDNFKLIGQVKNDYITQNRFYGNWIEIKHDEAEKLWNEEIAKLPEYRKESLHLISGVVLPVWDKLPTESVRIYRVLTSDGEMLIGRVIPEDRIDEVLRRLGSSRKKEKIATKDLIIGIKNGDTVYLENDWKIVQRKVSGENRIEVVGPSYEHYDLLTKKGVFTERIQYNTRYFVPADTNTERIINDLLKISPVMRVENAKYSIAESEDLSNEQTRNGILSGSSGREFNASTRKQAKRVSSYKQKLEGKSQSERKETAKKLAEKGYTEEIISGNHRYTLIKDAGYNDDMRSIISEAKAYGKEVGFFVGNATRKFDGQRNFKIDGIKVSDKKILIRYDGAYSPQALLMHELVHTEWDNPEMQKAKDIILSDLSENDKEKILQSGRYKAYMDLYNGNVESVWEEFIADVFADMSNYSDDYIDTAVDYWYNDKVIDRYNPSGYIKSMDSGGNETVLDKIGFGNDYSLSDNDFNIPYNEKRQLDDYVLRKNHSGSKLEKVDCKEIGNNFYVWENNSKTDYAVVNMVEIDGNEDLIDDLREVVKNGTHGFTKQFGSAYDGRSGNGRRSNSMLNAVYQRRKSANGNGGIPSEQSGSNKVGHSGKSSGNKQTKYSLNAYETDAEKLTPERKKAIFEQYNKDRVGVEKPTLKQVWGERAEWVAHNAARVFPNIPERGDKGTFFAEFRKNMIQWKNLPTTASFMVQDKLNKMTEGLSPDEFKTFSELVYFLDLQEEAQIQKERGYDEILLPNEITPREVDELINVLNGEATDKVQQALIKRQNIWEALKSQYIDLNRYIGFDTDGKFKRKNYYHHQVIDYMNNDKGGTGSREIGIKAGRGWLKERQGSTKAINTDFLAVEYKAMLQMQYDVYIAETLGKIKQKYDIKPQLEKEAFENNKKALNNIIQKECTGKDGNIMLDNKGKPDSETYRKQKWYNARIMWGFNGLFDLAERGELPDYDGEYANVVETLKKHDLNANGLYKYVGTIANITLSDNATDGQEQAVQNARTVLKYTAQKRAWIKELLADDYQTWETIAKSMSDTHVIHQPRRGNYFYTKTILDEDAFNKAHEDMVLSLVSGEVDLGNVDVSKLFKQYSDTVRLTGAAYEQWVLPKEIVTTMDEIANPKQASEGVKVARAIVSAWKGWATSVNPLRTVKFGLRNLGGDLDAVIAGNPKVVLCSKQAAQEIYQAMRYKNYSNNFMEWVRRGGYTSMLFANEMDTEMQDKLFSHLKDKQGTNIFKIPVKVFEKYYNGVENVQNFREAILRYSAYLYFKNVISKNNGNVKDYVASNRYIVRGLDSVEDKAYQLSKDLLGAYDEVGRLGQTLRRYWIPFYSFTETNMKRYYRIFENTIMSDDKIPKKAGKLLLKALMANMMMLIMIAWNKLVMKDEDDKLPPSTRNVPHITLGQIGDNVYAFRQLGSFSELLEWIGLDDYKWTKEDLAAPVDKAWGMITPFVKMPVELASGLNFYPSLTQPRAIRDKWQHFFNSLGVDSIYNEVTGKPTRGIGEILKGTVIYNYDYKESAYYEILDIKREWQSSDSGSIYKPTPKSNALYYMKTAVRYKDKKAALKYLDKYFENGGTGKGIKQSFATLNPMYGFTAKDTVEKGNEFIASLSDVQKEKLKIAQDFYENDLMLPQDVLSRLGKKDITDEEAKNLLKNYINAKCK